MPTRRVFILTQDGSILPESTKEQIQIMLNDSDDTHYQYMEGDDWLPAYRVGYNLNSGHRKSPPVVNQSSSKSPSTYC